MTTVDTYAIQHHHHDQVSISVPSLQRQQWESIHDDALLLALIIIIPLWDIFQHHLLAWCRRLHLLLLLLLEDSHSRQPHSTVPLPYLYSLFPPNDLPIGPHIVSLLRLERELPFAAIALHFAAFLSLSLSLSLLSVTVLFSHHHITVNSNSLPSDLMTRRRFDDHVFPWLPEINRLISAHSL